MKKIGNSKYQCSGVEEIVLVSNKENDNSEWSWKDMADSVIKRSVTVPEATHAAICNKNNWLKKILSWHSGISPIYFFFKEFNVACCNIEDSIGRDEWKIQGTTEIASEHMSIHVPVANFFMMLQMEGSICKTHKKQKRLVLTSSPKTIKDKLLL